MDCEKKKKNIILDMDHTLFDTDSMKPRPFLKDFLRFCFVNFETVAIWTAANRSWFDNVYKKVLSDALPLGEDFHFVWTGEKCSRCAIVMDGCYDKFDAVNTKPLKKIWKKYGPVINKHNTLIVDDNPFTYVGNYGNAIPISPYHGSDDDRAFIHLIVFLATLLPHESVLNIDKKHWEKQHIITCMQDLYKMPLTINCSSIAAAAVNK